MALGDWSPIDPNEFDRLYGTGTYGVESVGTTDEYPRLPGRPNARPAPHRLASVVCPHDLDKDGLCRCAHCTHHNCCWYTDGGYKEHVSLASTRPNRAWLDAALEEVMA